MVLKRDSEEFDHFEESLSTLGVEYVMGKGIDGMGSWG